MTHPIDPTIEAARALRLVLAIADNPSQNPGERVDLAPKTREQIEWVLAALPSPSAAPDGVTIIERKGKPKLFDVHVNGAQIGWVIHAIDEVPNTVPVTGWRGLLNSHTHGTDVVTRALYPTPSRAAEALRDLTVIP